LDQVEHVVQIGIRQLTNQPLTHDKVTQFPGNLACNKKEELMEALRDDIPYYVTIDVDVLDPSVMPATGTPLPGGLLYRELRDLLELITKQTHIIGLDIVEFLPQEKEIDGVIVSEMILNVISNVMEWENEHFTESPNALTNS
ncbi:arginase family protein, partial [Bacillus sp. LL01]|uniref:arginase family protein n=1 Tax=Bacillus sp. LL01 TaxID=1665556 RepID=UPI00064D0BE5